MTELTHPELIALKEYMEAKCEGRLHGTLTFEVTPNNGWSVKNIIRLYNKTGMLVIPPTNLFTPIFTLPTFEDYYKNIYLVSPKNLIIPVQNQPLNI